MRLGSYQGLFKMKNRIYVSFLVCALVLFPIRKSEALLPLGIALGYSASGATFTAGVETGVIYGLGLIGVGLGIGFVTGADGSRVAVPMTDGDPVPDPNAPATVSPTPEQSNPVFCIGLLPAFQATTYSATRQGSCDALGGTFNDYFLKCEITTAQCIAAGWTGCPSPTYNANISTCYQVTPASCPDGYELAGTICNLTDAKKAVQDNLQAVNRNNGVLDVTLGDLHGSLSATPSTTNSPNDTISISGVNSLNQPTQISFVTTPAGTTIMQSIQTTDSGGSSFVQQQIINVDNGGIVVGGGSTAINATLQPSTGGSGFTVVPNDPSVIPADPVSTTGGNFPNDYANSTDIADAAASININLAGLGQKLDTANGHLTNIEGSLSDTSDVVDPATDPELAVPSVSQSFNPLLNWSLPTHTSACPEAVFDLTDSLGQVYVMNQHCALFSDNFAVLASAMLLFWSISALFVVLRA